MFLNQNQLSDLGGFEIIDWCSAEPGLIEISLEEGVWLGHRKVGHLRKNSDERKNIIYTSFFY